MSDKRNSNSENKGKGLSHRRDANNTSMSLKINKTLENLPLNVLEVFLEYPHLLPEEYRPKLVELKQNKSKEDINTIDPYYLGGCI